MRCALCLNLSNVAAANKRFGNASPHSLKSRLLVTSVEVFSYRWEIKWGRVEELTKNGISIFRAKQPSKNVLLNGLQFFEPLQQHQCHPYFF